MDDQEKKRKKAEYDRNRRLMLSAEQKKADADRKRLSRENQTPEQLQREAERSQVRREKQTPEQLQREAERGQLRRENLTPEQLQCEAVRGQLRRENQTPEQLQREADRSQARREIQSPVQLQREAERSQDRRDSQTEEERLQEAERSKRRRTDEGYREAENVAHRQWRHHRIEVDPDFEDNENARRRRLPPAPKYVARDPLARPQLHYLGKMDVQCGECGAFHFEEERNARKEFSSCCERGTIKLDPLQPYPALFTEWLTLETGDAKHFRAHLRKYNSAFAFASFGYQPVTFPSGPQPVVVHGQVYHRTVQSLDKCDKPTYAKLYFLDPEFANRERLDNEHNKGCKENFMTIIEATLRDINPYAAGFKMMRDVLLDHGTTGSVQMWITKDKQQDKRRYNLPTVNEVAAVFVSENGEPPFDRDIAVYPVGEHALQNINIISPNCDPMCYPLLFPSGDNGWQPYMLRNGDVEVAMRDTGDENGRTKHISMLEFYSFRLQERPQFSPLLHSGKLGQQYIIDAFLKVEGHRLEWNRRNQGTLRTDLYLGLMDYVQNQAEQRNLKPGRMVILPSSFTGGKRALQQNYQDAMVIVAKFGKPDLFITFTCNPKWQEITDALQYGETAMDRPDIVAAVFHLKLKEFMNDLIQPKGGVLGKVKAHLSVIEFQKRGLPHCHMLFILDEQDKLRESEEVDKVVCAEIPDITDKDLYDIVTTCMIHGPCGEHNKKAPCMAEEGGIVQCTKKFPKDFRSATDLNVDGYPLYRRRDDGRVISVKGITLDNRYVVPYNPYLTRKFQAHINVEICSSVQSVKYIFKYIYKGHDAAIVQVNEGEGTFNWDEVKTFLDTRYISAPEAMWRIRKYDMYKRSHAIERLPVHLPWHQIVVFQEGSEVEGLRSAEKKGTKLTKWFELNQTDPDARDYLYTEIPYHYVWQKNTWKHRQRGAEKILPRIYSVSPKDMEKYCLRLLLLHVRGAQSYEDLRTVNDVVYDTFLGAAKAFNLLEDDKEWDKAMEEATLYQMPNELRQLFVAILIHGCPSDAKVLYEKFKLAMSEDFLLQYEQETALQLSLKAITDSLAQFGKTHAHFGLPVPSQDLNLSDTVNIERETQEAETLESKMNVEQRAAYDAIMDAVEGKCQNKCFFLSGAGGTGKTFVYKALTARILSQGGTVRAVAPTGLAATLLRGGKTVHSGFGITVNLDESTISWFKQNGPQWSELSKVRLIIWDEISMCHIHLLAAVDRSLRDLNNRPDEPFGGIPIVVGGDFRQQAPVVLHGNRVKIVEACVKSSSLWKCFKKLELKRNMRVNEDEVEFMEWLLAIGGGIDEEKESDFVRIPTELLCDDIVSAVFGNDIQNLTPDDLGARAILCPKNEDTLRINEDILSKLAGDVKMYFSVDTIADCESEDERNQYPIEFLHSLTPMGLPPHCLRLKKGCCVTLLRNLNPKQGLCNGTRLIVTNLGANLVECIIFSGHHKGQRVFIPRISLDVRDSDLPFQLKRKQYPLRLAYSMTITKSQGQTFDRIGVYLPDPVFTHGQLYTAFSRVRSKQGLFVKFKDGTRQGKVFESDPNVYVYNCVFREILQ